MVQTDVLQLEQLLQITFELGVHQPQLILVQLDLLVNLVMSSILGYDPNVAKTA